MRILMMRVGLDSASGGGLSPIYKDGSFDFIPIPETKETTETLRYDQMTGKNGQPLSNHVDSEHNSSPPHNDPEFQTYTYGDPTQKRRQLAELTEDDLLLFYAGLRPADYDDSPRLFIVGYFTIDEVHNLNEMTAEKREEVLDRLDRNAHAKRVETTPHSPHPDQDAFPVIIKGKPEDSRLLDRARPLSDSFVPGANPRYYMLDNVAALTGYSKKKDLTRATGRWLSPPDERLFRRWLDGDSTGLVDEQTSLRSYVLKHDTGFAPNVSGGYCTLATCKSRIRKNADAGDWIVGTGSRAKGDKDERLLYAMRVEDVLTYDEYFSRREFEYKKPVDGELHDPDGDNIYYTAENAGGKQFNNDGKRTYYEIDLPSGGRAYTTDDGPFVQLENIHHPPEKIPDDTPESKSDQAVLVGRHFWYFGSDRVHIPDDGQMREDVVIAYPGPQGKIGHETQDDRDSVEEFVTWLTTSFRPGIHGSPRDVDESGEKSYHTDC